MRSCEYNLFCRIAYNCISDILQTSFSSLCYFQIVLLSYPLYLPYFMCQGVAVPRLHPFFYASNNTLLCVVNLVLPYLFSISENVIFLFPLPMCSPSFQYHFLRFLLHLNPITFKSSLYGYVSPSSHIQAPTKLISIPLKLIIFPISHVMLCHSPSRTY